MTRDDFLTKWRYELAGLIFEASAMGGTDFKVKRAALLHRVEESLKGMFDDLAEPPGPVPPKVLDAARALYSAIQETKPKEPQKGIK